MGYFNRFLEEADTDEETEYEQITFDSFLNEIENAGDSITSSDIDAMIKKLQAAKIQRQQEEEAKRKAEAERKAAEERARAEAEKERRRQEQQVMPPNYIGRNPFNHKLICLMLPPFYNV